MYNLVDKNQFEEMWHKLALTHSGDAYVTQHKDRFYELFDHLAHFVGERPNPRVLEVGVSPFTRFYKALFPNIDLVTVDRALALGGVNHHFGVGECKATAHYNIDLNVEGLSPQWGKSPLGRFDYIIFSEVLEHLTVGADQLFEELLSLLKPNGFLYITTPNFFSSLRLQQIARRENPQEMFPRRDGNADAHCHYREYTMTELLKSVEKAGGRVVKAAFSDCWYDDAIKKMLHGQNQLRSNLLVVAVRTESSYPVEEMLLGTSNDEDNEIVNSEIVTSLRVENMQLRQLVHNYENGRFIRLMKWLKNYRR